MDITESGLCVRKLYWQDVRKEVAATNPIFAKLIDEISPGKDLPLYVASYPYGDVLFHKGEFFLPTINNDLISIHSDRVPDELKSAFQYSEKSLPAGFILDKSLEVFIEGDNGVYPRAMYSKGSFFAFWKYLEDKSARYHPYQMFSVTSGARSICMIPNIGDNGMHQNLRRDFNINEDAPKNLKDHWDVFKSITRSSAAKNQWKTKILLFPDKWLDKIRQDVAWVLFHNFLLKSMWEGTGFWRNQLFYSFGLSTALAKKRNRLNPYLLDTVKHLLSVAVGALPGFGVSTNDDAAPVDLLQKIYIESYGLKKYIPTIMHLMHFNNCPNRAIYYSFQIPTTLEFSPTSRKLSSTLHDLKECMHIMDTFTDEVLHGNLGIEDTVIADIMRSVDIKCYHSKLDAEHRVLLTEEIPKHDELLLQCPKQYGERMFAEAGAFVRGCVQLAKK